MSSADRSQYDEAVTGISEGELKDVLTAAGTPTCLLGGWAVYLQVTDGFREAHGQAYIGSRDIDLGIHVDPDWSTEDLADSTVAITLDHIETELGYRRGRFGFYQEFHRETGERLDDEAARQEPPHNVFRLDIDILPDTTALDAFQDAFGFHPPAEPLLEPVFEEDAGEPLSEFVDWTAETESHIAPAILLGAMKVRSAPDRDKSHKLLKDLLDLHALLWYVADYDEMRTAVRGWLTEEDIDEFSTMTSSDLYEQAAGLVDIDPTVVQQSIEGL